MSRREGKTEALVKYHGLMNLRANLRILFLQARKSVLVSEGKEYLLAFAALCLLTGSNALLRPLIGYWSVALLFLLGVMGMACILSLWPALLSAALSALLWNVFFIPPRLKLQIRSFQDLLMCMTYIVVALLIVGLTARIRAQEASVRLREKRLELLNRFSQLLVEAGSRETLLALAEEEMTQALESAVAILPSAVAERTTPNADAHLLPLAGAAGDYGVLRLSRDAILDQGQLTLLETLGRQLTLALDRETLHEAAAEAQLSRFSETLYNSLFDSVSHELKTPLTAIRCAIDNLRQPQVLSQSELRQALLEDLEEAGRRLTHLVANLLDMSRLQASHLTLNREWCEAGDIVRAALKALQQDLGETPLQIEIPPDLPLLHVDFGLLEQALINLIHNAFTHNSPGTGICISLSSDGKELEMHVADNGRGIPPESLPQLFEKFYRAPGTRSSGTGIGLSITRGFVEAHQGRIRVENLPQGGSCFTLSLPVPELPDLPAEDEDVPAYSGR